MARRKFVFVTGGSGFIGKHIVRRLLDEGFAVRASVRSDQKAEETRAAMAANVKDGVDLDKFLSFAKLDLTQDHGWADALKGARALIHCASPFPMTQPEDENDLIEPAVDGTRRAIQAALDAGVGRVVLTSSVVSVMYRTLSVGRDRYDESDWTDVNHPAANAYAKSKLLAEKAAWSMAKANPDLKLSVINPSLVLGPPLDQDIGTSVGILQRFLRGKDPMLPNMGVSIVDVRDVALAHVRALQRDASIGQRFICSERFMWFHEIAQVLAAEYPDRKIPTRVAPDFLIRFLALFDKNLKSITPLLGEAHQLSNEQAHDVLGIEFIEARNAIKTSAQALVRDGMVDG